MEEAAVVVPGGGVKPQRAVTRDGGVRWCTFFWVALRGVSACSMVEWSALRGSGRVLLTTKKLLSDDTRQAVYVKEAQATFRGPVLQEVNGECWHAKALEHSGVSAKVLIEKSLLGGARRGAGPYGRRR